jgi:phenylpropionate dioxygenase-like ring-hydroxylating dioxygenase large terminal subunit
MTTAADNELMTRIGAGTAAGRLLRQYWQPAALVEELNAKRPVAPIRLLGENLVLFRDKDGRYGLMERACPHRGADLCFGRLEAGGLRCAFHGWLFDATGQCLEQPGEPLNSRAYSHLNHRAYPCKERNGVIFAFLGEGVPPPFPAFDCFVAPSEQTFAFKGFWECNWLQALEVGIDPVHPSFLHRFLSDESTDAAYGRQFRAASAHSEMPLTQILREYPRPNIQVENTEYGFRLVTSRDLNDSTTHYRITNLIFPNAIAIPMSSEMIITQWHVPIDDTSCYWYSMFTSFGTAVDRETMRSQRLENQVLPGYRPKQNRMSNWGYDPQDQALRTYTGLGLDVNTHDQWAVESPGAIHDRTREHLGRSDVGIIKYRKLLMAGLRDIQAGKAVPFMLTDAEAARLLGPVAVDAIGARSAQSKCWRRTDRERRENSTWSKTLVPD